MLKKTFLVALAAALVMMIVPADVNAYGAAHVGYTHVGPNGVYHAGATEVSRPGGAYGAEGYRYGATGGAYRYGAGGAYGGAYHTGTTAAYGGYHATTSYGGAYHYGYVR